MALQVRDNGYVEIKSRRDAVEALKRFNNLKAEIDALKEESGLDDLEKDATAYKAAVQTYMNTHNIDQLDGDGFHGTLVKGFGDARWIATEDDLKGDEPDTVIPLIQIIEEKFGSVKLKGSPGRRLWLKITKRVADPEAIEDAVNSGSLKAEEIAPAFVEKPRTPYLRLFSDTE
jgi:hypothetical protein